MSEKSKKILIAEDEKPIARALELKLKSEGFEVVIANNGEEAINILQDDKIDFMLLDLVMPVMDGFSVLKNMQEKNIKVPVVVASNLGQDEDIKKAKEFGIKNYFVKSDTSLAEIVQLVKSMVAK